MKEAEPQEKYSTLQITIDRKTGREISRKVIPDTVEMANKDFYRLILEGICGGSVTHTVKDFVKWTESRHE